MPYNVLLADRIRIFLSDLPQFHVEEKSMFSGLAFMVNGKMCINVSEETLMCRFDPILQEEVAQKPGYEPMVMRGKKLNGYCYVSPIGFTHEQDFRYWMNLCLNYNKDAKASKKKKKPKLA